MTYVDVTVKVPADQLGAFYRAVGEWISGQATPSNPRARSCEECGTPFIPARGGRYCRTACSQRARYRRVQAAKA
jgi:hypothetical protein